MLEVPVQARRHPWGKDQGKPRRDDEAPSGPKQFRPGSQEKPLSFSPETTVPQTDTGGQVEHTQALERTQEKELGKLIP